MQREVEGSPGTPLSGPQLPYNYQYTFHGMLAMFVNSVYMCKTAIG